MRNILTIIIFIFALSGCSGFPHDGHVDITKSVNDDREYRYLELDNGLKVMLVSDPQTDFSAASLDVYVGSSSDPVHRQGLAHFLEHMLFLGTEKYPEADAYDKYLKDNGGHHNAYTSFEHTNYFFDIKPEVLDATLDRFAQFFIAPLLDETYVEREKHAVHSEYKAGIKDESRRGGDVLRQVINPAHPFRQFSVGNLETLSSTKTPIKEDLVKFYQQHYVANNMALAVLGKESLDQLETMVKEKFSPIKYHPVRHDDIKAPIFMTDNPPQIIYVKPEKNIRELSLLFPVPDQVAYYQSQPLEVIAHVLGHEGKGSLLSYLKEKNWVESLSASHGFNYKGGGLFSIDMELTERGLAQKDEVIIAVFQAIKRLEIEGLPRWIFNEISLVSELEFDFLAEPDPQGYVLSIARGLHHYPPQDVLSVGYKLDQYKPQLIHELLDKLSIDNVMMMLVTNEFEPVAESDFYRVPYLVLPVDAVLQDKIRNADMNANIGLPEKNTLLPENLDLSEEHKNQDKPEILVEKTGVQLWHKPLQQFQVPKATSYINLRKENVRAKLESSVLLDVYIEMLNDSFNEWIYSAQMAGLSLQLYGQLRGITLKINGFSDKQDEFLLQAFNYIKTVKFDSRQFDRIKDGMLKDWENAEKLTPYKKLMATWMESLQVPAWTSQEKIAALGKLRLEDVDTFGNDFWRDLDVVAMTNGNITAAQSRQMLATVEEFVAGHKTVRSDVKIVRLPEKNVHKTISSEHEDAGYFLYWQAEQNDNASRARFMLLAKALEGPFFNQLRTEQQLGYVVFASYTPLMSVPGVAFVVQSPVASVSQIHQSVMDFLKGSEAELKTLSPEYMRQLQQALRQELLEKPLSLVDESESYWYDLAMGYTGFDRKEQLAQAISAVNITDWQAFITALFRQPLARMYILSTKSAPLSGYTPVDDLKSATEVKYFHQY